MIRQIDSFSYTNKLRPVSPLWKSGFAAVLFLLSYVSPPLVQTAIFGWISVWIVVYAKISFKFYLGLLGMSCLFYIASLPALLAEIQATPSAADSPGGTILLAAAHWIVYVRPSGAAFAGMLGLRIIAASSCLLFLILTTPFSQLLQILNKLRVPTLVLQLMLIMYRFLFLLSDTATNMYTAQRARGGHHGFRNKLADTAVMVSRLFVKTMLQYKNLSYGLASRGFIDEIRTAPYEAAPIPRRYYWESLIGVVLLAGLSIWLYGRKL
ncbi:cobalt ECF transporter T component CbiQ [Ferviditalea candida]|uniref:Cobalt ECF transporter T component CbiQ n=1 Tax=Ferviditalea candida TaxID=3108399 RepID=A0ABU5ZK61_9BACL|nr:cobalt ECF transporter T component CbiQ [Paenibacillaceae bacterium T2]